MKNYFTFDQKIVFSKAVYYDLNPVRGKRTWRDATGGFGDFVPLQRSIERDDTEPASGRTFGSSGMLDNILPLVMTGESRTYHEWYHYLYWKLRNFGFQSGQICDLGQFDRIMLEIMAEREQKPLHRFLGAEKDWAAIYKGGGSLLLTDAELCPRGQHHRQIQGGQRLGPGHGPGRGAPSAGPGGGGPRHRDRGGRQPGLGGGGRPPFC